MKELTGPRYFERLSRLIELGHFAKMSNSALRFYVYLCWMSDGTNRPGELVDVDIVTIAGIGKRTLATVRKELSSMGLIVFDRQFGHPTYYTLCDLPHKTAEPGDLDSFLSALSVPAVAR